MDKPNIQAIYTTPCTMAQINDTVCSNIDRGKHKESNWRATSSDVIPSRLFINSPHNVTCGRRLHQTNMKPPRARARTRQREVHCLLTPQTITSEHFRSWKFACHRFRRTCHFALWSATTSREALQVVWGKESTWRITRSPLGWNRQWIL